MSDVEQRAPFLRRCLGDRLRELRKAAGLTPKEVAAEIGISTATLSKIETGKQAVKPAYVKLMWPLYAVDAEERARLLRMAEESGKPGRLSRYSTILRGDFVDYHEMEGQAEAIWVHEPGLVFGPFQVPDYVRAIRRAAKPDSDEDDLAASVELRQFRFKDLTGDRAPAVDIVLDQAVLCREVGGREVMREQLGLLADVAGLPNVDLRIIPFEAGAYAAQGAGFAVLRLPPEPRKDVVFIESDLVAEYLDHPSEVARYREMFEQAGQLALTPSESVDLMDRLRSSL
ncbi:helix-turn-helix domain-containing protein [Saccharothrix coeruleofusca]|uniref:Transcriptional regulator n=1 Tax=Saccharothrix coeruleofusca TaxID=33919 RepID=A0A918AU51_9PSEU|nr:helix-turn-helix transcriptional regulator [Saccharothrix coeruleofusca]GGP71321.1 transcriptional regulator [Saccharothrix coeruleofusca]